MLPHSKLYLILTISDIAKYPQLKWTFLTLASEDSDSSHLLVHPVIPALILLSKIIEYISYHQLYIKVTHLHTAPV